MALGNLTHLPWTKWPPFWQMTFSNAFLWMKMIEFKFHWWSNWQYPSTGWYNGLVMNRRQAIICTNADLILWRIYAALGEDLLTCCYLLYSYVLWNGLSYLQRPYIASRFSHFYPSNLLFPLYYGTYNLGTLNAILTKIIYRSDSWLNSPPMVLQHAYNPTHVKRICQQISTHT